MTKKKQQKLAKLMFKESRNSQGFIDPQKVRQILRKINLQQKDVIKILKIYKNLIAVALAKEKVIIETGQKIKFGIKLEKKILAQTGADKVVYKVSPQIVFGARLTHGDWIWDATLDSKLRQLTSNI